MASWEWLTFAGTLASILGLFGLWSDRRSSKLMASIHTATQSTLTDISKGFRDSQQQMARELGAILDRMDQRAEERYRDLRGHIGGEV